MGDRKHSHQQSRDPYVVGNSDFWSKVEQLLLGIRDLVNQKRPLETPRKKAVAWGGGLASNDVQSLHGACGMRLRVHGIFSIQRARLGVGWLWDVGLRVLGQIF